MNRTQKANLAIDPANMDTTVDPGKDFYHYANGGWIEAHPIGDEYSQYGVLFGFFGTTDPANSEMVMATFSQGGLGLPDVEYYTSGDERSAEIRKKYVEHIERIFTLCDFADEEAKAKASAIMELETRLAENP